MTWTKLGDEYGDQCWKLSDSAHRLHTEALVWSNRRHLDGRLVRTVEPTHGPMGRSGAGTQRTGRGQIVPRRRP